MTPQELGEEPVYCKITLFMGEEGGKRFILSFQKWLFSSCTVEQTLEQDLEAVRGWLSFDG